MIRPRLSSNHELNSTQKKVIDHTHQKSKHGRATINDECEKWRQEKKKKNLHNFSYSFYLHPKGKSHGNFELKFNLILEFWNVEGFWKNFQLFVSMVKKRSNWNFTELFYYYWIKQKLIQFPQNTNSRKGKK